MPLNRPNPAAGRPVPPGFPAIPPYITPQGIPTNDPGTADAAPSTAAEPSVGVVQVPSTQNIDPNASAPRPSPLAPTTPNTAGAAGATGGGGANPTQVSLPAGASPLAEQMLRDVNAQVDQANVDVAQQGKLIRDLQSKLDAAQIGPNADPTVATQLTQQINAAYTTLSASETRLATASKNQADTSQKVLDSVQLTPEQADYYRAQGASARANAAKADEDTKVLHDGADTQKAYTAAQAELASASALNQRATAQATADKSPAEITALKSQGDYYGAQANQINELLPGLKQKQAADTTLTTAQAGLTDSQSELAKAQTAQAGANTDLIKAQATLLTPAQAASQQGSANLANAQAGQLVPAQAAEAQSNAALNQAKIQQAQLGPLYGLQDQIKAITAIRDQVFGPGGSGNPQDANDLLNQFVSSAIGGTTPYAASVAAQNAQQNIFGTQAALTNQAAAAAASRANAYTGFGGNVLATLAGMNANAPKGSSLMAGAFSDVLNNMASRLQAPQFAAPPQPQAPPLPPFLQRFAAPPGAGAPGAGPPAVAGAPLTPGPGPGARPLIGAVGPPPTGGAPQTSAPVTINIGSNAQTSPAAPAPAAPPVPNQPPAGVAPPAAVAGANYGAGTAYSPGWTPGQGTTPQRLPATLAAYAPPDMDFLHQLWGNELQSGSVTSPYLSGAAA